MSRRMLQITLRLGLLLLAAVAITLGGAEQAAQAAGPAVAQTAVTPPPARYGASMAYDAANGTVVLFGGAAITGNTVTVLSDTWIWDGSSWSQPASPCGAGGCPPARAAAGMASASASGLGLGRGVLLFGGASGTSSMGDTWFWQGSSWTQVASGGPPARSDASVAYDAANGTTVLFGGFTNAGNLNDTWVWNGSAWTALCGTASTPACGAANCGPSPQPACLPARGDASMAYDAANGAVVLFGGQGTSASLNDTWLWDGTIWRHALSTDCTSACPNSPPSRLGAGMTADPLTYTVVLFGGCCVTGTVPNDTWVWNGSGWSQQQLAVSPPGRVYASMAEDPVTRTLVLFGGVSRFGGVLTALNDTWLWDESTWNPTCGVSTTPASPPCVLGLSTSFGPAAGGTSVTLSGSGFTGTTAAFFGQTPATSFSVTSDTALTAAAPPGTDGTTVDVSVVTSAGVSRLIPADQFTYAVAPTVTGISPANGPTGGGTTVTISGTGFSTTPGTTTVQFGSQQAQIASLGSDLAPRPPSLERKGETGGGEVSLSPQSSVLSPHLGNASVACASSTLCYAIAPPGSGTVDVRVTAFGLQSAVSAGDQFLYALAPAVSAVSPRAGPSGGGGAVSISGSGFLNATGVTFGGAAATSFTVSSDSALTAAPPAGTVGSVVDVQVTTAVGTSPTHAADSFTYVLRGDANASGVTDAVDALCVLRQVARLPGTQACPMPLQGNADVNGDGQVTAVDALCVLRLVAHLSDTPACTPPPSAAATGSPPMLAPGAAVSAPVEGGMSSQAVPQQASISPLHVARRGAGGEAIPVRLSLQPDGGYGGERTLALVADAGSGTLGAWTIDLLYDPTLVQVAGCQAEAGGVCNSSYAPGVVRVSGAAVGGLSGTHTLATITVEGAAAKTAKGLQVQAAAITDATGAPLPAGLR
jgi:hypothetical protein